MSVLGQKQTSEQVRPPSIGSRLADLVRFYAILADLESKVSTARRIAECSGRMDWPRRGLYFFARLEKGNGMAVFAITFSLGTFINGAKLVCAEMRD